MLTIIGLIISLIGILPVIFDFSQYTERLKLTFSKSDLVIDIIQITYDIKKITKVNVYITAKYRVNRHDAILRFPVKNIFGKTNNFMMLIDNKKVNPTISENGYKSEATYKLYNKNKGDTFILDLKFTFTNEDEEEIKQKEDGMGYYLRHYRCKQLKLTVIFPKGYYPDNMRFLQGKSFENEFSKKEKFGMIKTPSLCENNRRKIEWLINYPKYKTGYWIKWKW